MRKLGARLLQALLRRYARMEAAAVAPFLIGRRVLDLGAGEGFVALALRDVVGVLACSVDLGPFRRAPVPFVVYDGARLPFADGTFDTTLILLTLHHCADPEVVLDEALRVTRRRLLVTESVYRSRLDRFWLELLDQPVNRLRHDGHMPAAGGFGTRAAWQRRFDARGLRTVEIRWLGSRWERLVHHPVLFVLEKPGVSAD